MKIEWRKHDKKLYLPNQKPELIEVPEFKFCTIAGVGNPNDAHFSDCIAVLYSVSYAIRMSYKSKNPPKDYYNYTVYPLEGEWDIADKSKHVEGELNKDNLAYTIMIRQPEFVTNHFFNEIIEAVKNKKPHELLNRVKFQVIKEGKCVQMLHVGSYDNEPASFNKIHNYCKENNLTRLSKKHREIYISDFRKTEPNKLKTVLRIKVK